jgi:hypothetical protein
MIKVSLVRGPQPLSAAFRELLSVAKAVQESILHEVERAPLQSGYVVLSSLLHELSQAIMTCEQALSRLPAISDQALIG